MVQVRAHQPINTDGSVNLEAWLDHVMSMDPALDRAALKEACEFARQAEQQANAAQNLWVEGASSFQTGLDIAEILADLKLDQDSLVAAVVYRGVREGKLPLEDVQARFGETVAKLIEGVLRMAAISASLNPRQSMVLGTQTQVDNLRKMLVAMVDDVRVALIKLAERTCAIRAVKNADDEKRQRVAREVFDIYAPLAHRLGIGHIKWELEDLSFRYLEPEQYKQIAQLLHERRLDREQYIADVMAQLREELAGAPSTSIRSGGRCSARGCSSARSTTSVPCGCWSPKCATATPRWASCTRCGATSPRSSTTTSPTPRRTATARCTPR
jgi:GTP pyrophosphokinase